MLGRWGLVWGVVFLVVFNGTLVMFWWLLVWCSYVLVSGFS